MQEVSGSIPLSSTTESVMGRVAAKKQSARFLRVPFV
jgi:hypothetical protein